MKKQSQAEPCFNEALGIYRQEEKTHDLDLANAIRPLAILKESVGDASTAAPLWEEARSLYESLGIQEGVSECSKHLARLRSDGRENFSN
jgi:hypothetical protein